MKKQTLVRDATVMLLALFAAYAMVMLTQAVMGRIEGVAMLIFMLAVFVTSMYTEGYAWGVAASLISVLAVNFAFLSPYFAFNFTLSENLFSGLVMLVVSIMTSTLTTRIKKQEQLRMETEREKMRANLLRAISHDLRTPLTSISGAISAVLDSGDSLSNAQRLELLSDARKDADWLYRMVENLLSITRISGDKPGAIKKEDEVLEEVLSEVVVKFKKKNPDITVSVTVPDDLFFVPMDAMLVEQLLMNLMDNAVQHGGGTSRITISTAKKDNFAEISVRDNGHGIPPSELDHLFDGSLQLGGDKIDKTRNMGIGLMVCKTIAVAHGGKIWAQNLPDGGAEFTFSLQLGEEKNEY